MTCEFKCGLYSGSTLLAFKHISEALLKSGKKLFASVYEIRVVHKAMADRVKFVRVVSCCIRFHLKPSTKPSIVMSK